MATNTEAPIGLRETLYWRSKSATPILGGGAVAVQYDATASINNTVAETSLWNTGAAAMNGTVVLPAGFLQSGVVQYTQPSSAFTSPGIVIRVKMFGTIANTATPTIRIKAKATSNVLSDTTALTMSAITGTTTFTLEYTSVVQAYSASVGVVRTSGIFSYMTATTGAYTSIALPYTTLGSLDLTASYTWDTSVTWGTANASNAIIPIHGTIEILG